MSPPLEPIVSFLGQHTPFDELTLAQRRQLASHWEIEYQRRGSIVLAPGDHCDRLRLVRSGGLREDDASGSLIAQYGEGASVGAEPMLDERPCRTSLSALEDTLVYTLSAERFLRLCRERPEIDQFFRGQAAGRLRSASIAPPRPDPGGASLTRRVGSLLVRPLVSVDASTNIAGAARQMTRERVSALLVTGHESLGIVTDRDLRSRVLAAGTSPEDPVHTIMSSPVAGVDLHASLLEALMEMMRRNVHHLAVFDAGAATGVITLSDLVQSHVANPVYVLGEIDRQDSRTGLIRVSRRRADVLLQMVAADARAPDTHRILTQIGDAITRRLLELAWAEVGADDAASDRYCWVAFGSQARQEHALGSDQDNGLILGDSLSSSNEPMRRVAESVCEGLAACGYPRCAGDIMAVTDQWRQPVSAWRRQFSRWIRQPTREAVMRGSIFFDMRAVHGDASLVTQLKEHVLEEIGKHPVFLSHLAHDAMGHRPPLGFFGRLVVDLAGEHRSTLNLKHQGLIPIVDLARVYGLEAGCQSPNTLLRLRHASERGGLSDSGCAELEDAFECIGAVRLRLHARQIRQGKTVDNHLDPTELSSAERGHLKDAFSVVSTIQRSMEASRQLTLFDT